MNFPRWLQLLDGANEAESGLDETAEEVIQSEGNTMSTQEIMFAELDENKNKTSKFSINDQTIKDVEDENNIRNNLNKIYENFNISIFGY